MEKYGVKKGIPYKYVIYICVLCLISILVIAFTCYTYYDYNRECQEIAGREAEYMVTRVVSQVDERLNNLKQYYLFAVEEDDIKWILENNLHYSDYSRYKAASDVMASKKIFGDYINGFTFVNFQSGWGLSSMGMFPVEETYYVEALNELFERNNDNVDKNYWVYDSAIIIENTVDRKYRVTVETGGLSLIMKLPLSSKNVYGMFIANINMSTWQAWVDQWLYEYEDVVVTDNEGNVIFATSDTLAESCLSRYNTESEESWQILKGGGKTYAVSAQVSDVLDWNYYVGYDMDNGQLAGFGLSGLLLATMAVLVLSCLLISTYVIYRPIDQLVKNVMEEDKRIEGNELNFLADRFVHLRDDKQVLEAVLIQQQDKLLELFELRLIRGEVRSNDEWNEYFNGLHLKACRCFAAVVMVLNLRGENEAQDSVDEDAICLKLVEELPRELKELAWMPVVYNACTIFCLFGSDDESSLLSHIMEFYDGIQKYTEETYGFRMLMGVSATHTDYHHIRAAYRESVNALTMLDPHVQAENGEDSGEVKDEEAKEERELSQLVNREDCHFYPGSSTVHGSAYNNSFEKDIQAGLKAMDKEQCYKVTDEFSQYLNETASHDEATVYILRFVNMILLTAIDTKLDLDKLFPDGLKKVYREIIEVIEPHRVRRYIKSRLIDPIISARNELMENSSYSMMEEIERKIEETRGNITLTECADALGVHSTYIWKVLKMEKGKSFSDYLEEYKVNEAKRLLLQTNLTVAEIAVELNYTNAQNFIRFFSKSTGITPGKFRKLY